VLFWVILLAVQGGLGLAAFDVYLGRLVALQTTDPHLTAE
jgi:hypothetical protein